MDSKCSFIIRCSDGWMRSCFGTYDDAVRIAQRYVGATNKTFVIA